MSRSSSAAVLDPPSPLLDTVELARRLAPVSQQTMKGWRMRGEGPPFIKVGRRVFYRESDVEAWLSKQTRNPGTK